MAKKRHHSERMREERHERAEEREIGREERYEMHHGQEGKMNPHFKRYYSEGHMEEKDAGMIKNDFSKLANLPTEVMMKPFPPCPAYMDYDIDDNIRGIDRQEGADDAARRRGFDPHKY